MKDSEYSKAIFIMLVIAILALILAINYHSLLASFISGFMFCALLEDHLKAKRELEELQ